MLNEYEVSELQNSSNAIVHGVVTDLSPLKRSKKDAKVRYFSGLLSDEKGCVRLISFEPSLRDPLYDALTKKTPVSVFNCEIRDAREGGSELLVTGSCKVQSSPKKFNVSNITGRASISSSRRGYYPSHRSSSHRQYYSQNCQCT